jgi:molecular chaperone GrpE
MGEERKNTERQTDGMAPAEANPLNDAAFETPTHATANGEPAAPVVEGEVIDTSAARVQDLEARIAQLEKEVTENKDNWLRATADFRNYKRRTEQERVDLIRGASAGLLLKLLPVLDDFERAINNLPVEVAETAWYGGFRLIPQKLQAILESEGVTPIEALGKEFDPAFHEAVIFEEGGGHTVTAELQKGYMLRDKVLRPTMVKVG